MSYHHPKTAFNLDRKKARRRVQMWRVYEKFRLSQVVDTGLSLLRRMHADDARSWTSKVLREGFRDFLATTDAADELLGVCAVGQARAVGRTTIEQGAALLYVMERNHETVSAAYVLNARLQIEESLRRFGEDQVEDFEEAMGAIREDRIRLENSDRPMLLASRELKELAERGSYPWYSVSGGPVGARSLLDSVGLARLYHGYYVPWSEHVHGAGAASTAFSEEINYPTRPLRFFAKSDYQTVDIFLKQWAVLICQSCQRYFFKSQISESDVEGTKRALLNLAGDPLLNPWSQLTLRSV